MRHLTEIRNLSEFSQAVEAFSKDREKLVELKGLLEQQLQDIKGQLMGLNAADGPQLEPEEVKEVRGRIHRAETAKSYVVKRMLKVDSLLARLSREGGWLIWVEWGSTFGWIASKAPPAEFLVADLEIHGKGAKEICFALPVTQSQWDRIPRDAVTFYEP